MSVGLTFLSQGKPTNVNRPIAVSMLSKLYNKYKYIFFLYSKEIPYHDGNLTK